MSSSHQTRLSHILNHLQSNPTSSKLTSKLTFVVITGCNRGLGYGIASYLLTNRAKYFVIATTRNPDKADKLKSLITRFPGRAAMVALDVSSEQSIKQSAQKVSQITDKVHVLINNAGISNAKHPVEHVLDCDATEMQQILNVNIVGAAMMLKAYHKLLTADNQQAPSKVINVSSGMGSLQMAMEKYWYRDPKLPLSTTSYRISKAGLNMLTRCQAVQVGERDNIVFLCFHPGHVITDMGTSYGSRSASVPVEDASHGLVTLMEKMNMETLNGTFYDWNHKQLPW